MFKSIMSHFVPCWYELSWRSAPGAIVLRVHSDFVKKTEVIPQESPIIAGFMEQFGFQTFGGEFTNDFGFDRSFAFKGIRNGFHEFRITLPVVRIFSKWKCRDCRGSGHNKSYNRMCIACNGKGRENSFDYNRAYAISASFTVFSALAYYLDEAAETTSSIPQILNVQTVTIRDMHGGSLSGEYSVFLGRYLSGLPVGTSVEKMVRAMKRAYKIMDQGLGPLPRFGASVDSDNGWLNVDCPGDACGLHPSHGLEDGRGYEFSCHNVDTPQQQLTLLAGLAALHDKARREIASYELA